MQASPSRAGSGGPPKTTRAQTVSCENNSIPDREGEDEIHERGDTHQQDSSAEITNKAKPGHGDDNQETDESAPKNKYHRKNMSNKDVMVGQLRCY